MTRPSMAECDALLTAPGTAFEIETITVDGREQKVWKNTPPTFRHHLLQRIGMFRDRVLVSSPLPSGKGRERFTYGEVLERALVLAAWLRQRGVGVGTRVGLGGANGTGWVVTFVAIHLLGAVPVVLNATLQTETQLHCLDVSRPGILLLDPRRAEELGRHVAKISSMGIEMFTWSPVPTRFASVSEVDLTEVSPSTVESVRRGDGLQGLGPDSDSMIMFTSGTTSQPKAVRLLQRGSLSHMRTTALPACRAVLRQGGDVASALAKFEPPPTQQSYLVAVPLFHVTGCLSWLVRAFTTGSKVVFMSRWNVDAAIRLMVDENITVVGGVPAIVTSILKSPNLPPNLPISNVSFGGAPPPAGLAATVLSKWPNATIVNGYGQTESNGIVTSLAGRDYVENPKSVGAPSPIAEVRVVDPETRAPLPTGETGLLLVRGTMVMAEYVGNLEATAATLSSDGWLDTGDLGRIDEQGWIWIEDRAKDMIIRGGENIASAEVEHALCLDERIAHAAAVPVPDEIMGERVGVAVTLAPGKKATEASILAAVEGRLRYAARPAIVVIVETLPRNAAGKVLKNDVKKTVQDEWGRRLKRAKL